MKIEALTPDKLILKELGARLAGVRKQQGFSQTRLAEEAGLGVATLRRIEAGKDSQMESWLKLLTALEMTAAIDAFIPEKFDSPMAAVLSETRKRRTKTEDGAGVKWGDETR